MFSDTAHDLKQIAAKLEVLPQTLLDLIGQGQLLGIKVSKRNIMIAEADLYIFLKRASLSAKPNPHQGVIDAIKAYLANQLAQSWLDDDRRKAPEQEQAVLKENALKLIEKTLAPDIASTARVRNGIRRIT